MVPNAFENIVCVCMCVCKDFLCEKVRNNSSCLHMVTYNDSKRWIVPSSGERPKISCHPTWVDVSSMMVKMFKNKKPKKVKRVVNACCVYFDQHDDTFTQVG